jgi:hypothetical protein
LRLHAAAGSGLLEGGIRSRPARTSRARRRILCAFPEEIVHLSVIAHHLVRFTRECLAGSAEASFYADPSRTAFGAPETPRAA